MASKKYLFIIGLLCLFVSGAFAQTISSYDMRDSSLIPSKRLPQHNEFQQNAYAFPAMPRNQWEIGIKLGTFTIYGDVPALFPTFGGGLHVRKALGYVFSLRGEFMYGVGKGLNWKQRTAGFSNPLLAAGYGTAAAPVVYDNYKTTSKNLNLQGIFSLNNIRFHRANTGWNAYALVGFGATWYQTDINATNNGALYTQYSTIAGNNYSNRKDTRSDLKDLLDDSYETEAETDGDARPKLGDNTLRANVQAGLGMAFKLSKKLNLAIEDKITVPLKDDLMDGQRWQNSGTTLGSRVLSPEYDIYNYFTVGLNLNLGSKRVEPLWWINPLDYAYNEINQPKHMKLPKPILDDADGDGVTDQFDQEPNTPAGAPVNTHGVSLDTDGDGVPDFRDKELITPTQCQPVDADGVGKCPPPACCEELRRYIDSMGVRSTGCNIGDLPSITFSGRTVTLSNDAKALLTSVAQRMRTNENCIIAVVGYGESSKSAQQLSWDRVNAVINYLVEKEGVRSERFIFRYGQGEGAENTVDLRDATGEEGPNTVPAPHPNLRRRG